MKFLIEELYSSFLFDIKNIVGFNYIFFHRIWYIQFWY